MVAARMQVKLLTDIGVSAVWAGSSNHSDVADGSIVLVCFEGLDYCIHVKCQ